MKTCLAAKFISGVWVSSDSAKILEAAVDAGATPSQRPTELAVDGTPTADVILDWLAKEKISSPVVAFVQCTAPLTEPADIDGTILRLLETDADVAIACSPTHDFQVRVGHEGRLRGLGWEFGAGPVRRQDIPETLSLAGSVWAINRERFIERGGRLYTENCVAYLVPRKLDIDEPADLDLANLILSSRKATERADSVTVQYPL